MAAKNHKSMLKVILSAFRYRYWTGLAVGLPIFGLFALLALLSPAYFKAQGKIKITPLSLDPNASPQLGNADIEDEISLLKSQPLIEETLAQLKKEGVAWTQTSALNTQNSLSISRDANSSTVELSFKDPQAQNAAKFINTHIEIFQKTKLNNQRLILQKVRQEIENRIPQANADLKAAQTALKQFNQKHQLTTATTSSSSAIAAYNQTQQELLSLQQQGQELDNQRQRLFQQLGINEQEAKTLSAIGQSPDFQKLIKDLRQLENQYKRKQGQLTPQHPEMVSLQRDISELQQGLSSEIQRITGNQGIQLQLLLAQDTNKILTTQLGKLENQRQNIIRRVNVLQNSLGVIQKNVVDLPKLERENQSLEQKLAQAQGNLDSLFNQKKQIEQDLDAKASGVAITAPATVPTRKMAPYQRPLLMMGLLTSLGLAGLGMWIAELRDRSLKTVEDAEDFLGLKVLGVIPDFEDLDQKFLYDGDLQREIPVVFSVDQPGSSISEAFRMLYLNLKVLPNAKSLQSLALTSSVPKEGKSTIAANLAAIIAQSGKSVLLIDGNLNHPFQSLIWNLPNDIGLSNILFSQASFLLAVKPISNNLDVLTSGSIRNLDRNPFESKQMRLFIADMASRYDCILFDLPAVNVSADAAIVAQLVDGVIFVSKPGTLDEHNASKAQKLLQQTKANVLGMILNGSDDPKDSFLPPEQDDLDELEDDPEDLEPLDLANSDSLEVNNFSNLGIHDIPGTATEVTLAQAFGQESLPELETHLETLQSQWAASKRLLDNKEEELIHLCHAKKDLEQQLNDMSLSLSDTEGREEKLEHCNQQILKTESRRQYLIKTIKTLRGKLKSEQDNFYAHLKVLQARHNHQVDRVESFKDDRPIV